MSQVVKRTWKNAGGIVTASSDVRVLKSKFTIEAYYLQITQVMYFAKKTDRIIFL